MKPIPILLLLLILISFSFAGLYTSSRSEVRYINISNNNNHTANTTFLSIGSGFFNASSGGALGGNWLSNCMDFYFTGAGNATATPSLVSDWDINFSIGDDAGAVACSYLGGVPNITAVLNLSGATNGGLPSGAWTWIAMYWHNITAISAFPVTNNASRAADVGNLFNYSDGVSFNGNGTYWTYDTFNGAGGTEYINGSAEQLSVNGPGSGAWRGAYLYSLPMRGNTSSPYYTIRTTYTTWTSQARESISGVGFFDPSTNSGLGVGGYAANGYASGNALLLETNFKTCCDVLPTLSGLGFGFGTNFTQVFQRNSIGNRTENATYYNTTNTTLIRAGMLPTLGDSAGFFVKKDTNTVEGDIFIKVYNMFAYNNFDNFTYTPGLTSGNSTTVSYSGPRPVQTYYRNSTIEYVVSGNTNSGNVTAFNTSIYFNTVNQTSLARNTSNGSLGFLNDTNASVINLTLASGTGLYKGLQIVQEAQAISTINFANSSRINSSILTINDSTPGVFFDLGFKNGTNLWFLANATFIDGDGATDIDHVLINTTFGTCSQLSNTSTGDYFNVSYNCTDTSPDTASIFIRFFDKNNTFITTSNRANTYPLPGFAISNITVNYTPFEYDLYSYNHGMNFTAIAGSTINSVTASYGGSTWLASFTNTGDIYFANVSIQPPFSNQTVNYTVNWTVTATLADMSTATNSTAYNISVNASGLYLCNSTINTPTVNYSFYDESTLLPVNASFTGTYSILSANGSIKQTQATFTNTTGTVCIGPSTGNFVVQTLAALVSASGYTGKTLSEINRTYNSTVYVNAIPLSNSSLTQPMTVTVQNPQGTPFVNYTVQLLRYYPATNTYNLSQSGVTNGQGIIVFQVEGAPASYAVLTYDNNNVLVQNITYPPVIFCASVPAGSTCTYTIVIGASQTDYYDGVRSTFDANSYCNFTTSTLILSCTWPGDPATANFIIQTLNLTLYNGSIANKTIITGATNLTLYSNSHTINITVPNISGYYQYVFFGNYIGSVNDSSLRGTREFQTGTITLNQNTNQPYGLDGWFITMVLCLMVGLVMGAAGGPALMVWGSGGIFLLMAIGGFIYLSAPTILALGVMFFIIGLWIKG